MSRGSTTRLSMGILCLMLAPVGTEFCVVPSLLVAEFVPMSMLPACDWLDLPPGDLGKVYTGTVLGELEEVMTVCALANVSTLACIFDICITN